MDVQPIEHGACRLRNRSRRRRQVQQDRKAITERLLIGFVDSRFFNIVAFYDPVRTYAAFKDWVPLRRALACNIERSLSQ
jgi:hypothetical protein